MENSPRAPSGCLTGAPAIVAVVGLILACVGMPWYYFINDYTYVEGTARKVQDAGALVAQGLAWGLVGFLVLVAGYGLVGLVLSSAGGWTRWASPAARDAYLQIELARAQHQVLPEAMSSMTITHNYNQRLPAPVATDLPGPFVFDAEEAPPALASPGAGEASSAGVLARLRREGQLTPGGLYVGQGEEGGARIDMATCGFIAIGGRSRSGKTRTTQLLIAQAVLQGWDVALCDPFPNKADGLMSLCKPLSGHFFKQAGAPEEIAKTIQLVDKIGRRRIDGERWERPVLLVIEEFSNVVIRGMLPPEILDLLPAMAMLYAAVGVHGVIIGHDFSRSMLGDRYGALLRRACTHRIAHRLAPDAAELLVPSSYAGQVVELRPGRALYWGEDSPLALDVPLIADADLTLAARGVAPKPYAPWAPRTIAQTPAEQIVERAPSRAVPPTTNLDIQAAEFILDCLRGTRLELDVKEIARRTGLAESTVNSTLAQLRAGELVTHRRDSRRFVYRILPPVEAA